MIRIFSGAMDQMDKRKFYIDLDSDRVLIFTPIRGQATSSRQSSGFETELHS